MRTIHGGAGVAGIFVAGFDAGNEPNYSGAIAAISTKLGPDALVAEAHTSPTAKDIKFKSEQGTFVVSTAAPTQ